jgi:SAM-dependent methyltransferase
MVLAGDVDWAARWQEMQRAVREVRRPAVAEGDRWRLRAARYDKFSRVAADRDGLPSPLAEDLRADDVVVDVGAGTGRHALLFARRCKRVIAIEPSAAMRARLQQRLDEERLRNVEIVDASWPALGVEPEVRAGAGAASGMEGDVVFSSHVLYGVDDAASFVAAMTASARRVAALYLGLRAPPGAIDPLWTALHGRLVPRRPAALEALAILHQLGAAASLAVQPDSARPYEMGADDEDLTELCHRLDLEVGDESKARVRAALAAVAPADARGVHVLGISGPNALLYWAPK